MIDKVQYLCGSESENIMIICNINGGTESFTTSLQLDQVLVQHQVLSGRNVSYTLQLEQTHHLRPVKCLASNGAGNISKLFQIFVSSKRVLHCLLVTRTQYKRLKEKYNIQLMSQYSIYVLLYLIFVWFILLNNYCFIITEEPASLPLFKPPKEIHLIGQEYLSKPAENITCLPPEARPAPTMIIYIGKYSTSAKSKICTTRVYSPIEPSRL